MNMMIVQMTNKNNLDSMYSNRCFIAIKQRLIDGLLVIEKIQEIEIVRIEIQIGNGNMIYILKKRHLLINQVMAQDDQDVVVVVVVSGLLKFQN